MATNQNDEFEQLLYAWWRITRQIFIKTFCQNTCSEISIKSYFHFSYYTSVETLSCHSNESTWATAIKNINFVNFMNISASSPLWLLRRWFFNIFSQILSLEKIHIFGRRLLKERFWKIFCKNICNEIEIKTYFHFSHCKSMETISCHSDESTWAIKRAIKNTIFVEANVMNISTKFQLHSPYGFWGEDFWIFFCKFSVLVAMATNQIQRFGQNSYAC